VHTSNISICKKKKTFSVVPYKRTVWRTMEKFHTAASVLSGVQYVWAKS